MFLKLGIKSVSIDEICNKMHISKRTFYNYFKQKESLIEALLAELREKHRHCEISDNRNIIDVLLNDTKIFKSQDSMQRHINFFFDLEKFYPRIYASHHEKALKNGEEFAYKCLEKGIEQGVFREEIDLVLMSKFAAMRFSSSFMNLKNSTSRSVTQITDFLMEAFMRMVTTPKGFEYYQELQKIKNDKK